MIEAAWIAFAFGMGLAARIVGLPPLVGYLGAGFALAERPVIFQYGVGGQSTRK